MLRRLFGRGDRTPDPVTPRPTVRVAPPQQLSRDSFHLHLHGVRAADAEPLLRESYLQHVPPGEQAMLLAERDNWLSVHFPRQVVAGVGFNRQAARLSRELGCWLVGYRLFADQGGDVHYFHAGEHVDQLAFTDEGVELEPDSPVSFAGLADVSGVVPRPPTQHPLDFHHALLAALGIPNAALTWDEVRHADPALLGRVRLVGR